MFYFFVSASLLYRAHVSMHVIKNEIVFFLMRKDLFNRPMPHLRPSNLQHCPASRCFLDFLYFPRFVWNFFRLENEHLNNCGKFRAVRDISVAPLDASDQQQIINMMDDPDPRNFFRCSLVLRRGAASVNNFVRPSVHYDSLTV